MTLWCGKCSRSILCLDILQVQSTICISHLHCNLMLSISNCAFSSFRSSLYWISIKLEGTKRSQKSSLEPLELAIASLQRMPSRPIRNGLAHLLCASASVRDEANCVPSACCYSGRYVCDTTDKLEATEVQCSFGLCSPARATYGGSHLILPSVSVAWREPHSLWTYETILTLNIIFVPWAEINNSPPM